MENLFLKQWLRREKGETVIRVWDPRSSWVIVSRFQSMQWCVAFGKLEHDYVQDGVWLFCVKRQVTRIGMWSQHSASTRIFLYRVEFSRLNFCGLSILDSNFPSNRFKGKFELCEHVQNWSLFFFKGFLCCDDRTILQFLWGLWLRQQKL